MELAARANNGLEGTGIRSVMHPVSLLQVVRVERWPLHYSRTFTPHYTSGSCTQDSSYLVGNVRLGWFQVP